MHNLLSPVLTHNHAPRQCRFRDRKFVYHTIESQCLTSSVQLDTKDDWRFCQADGTPRYYAGQTFSLPLQPSDSPPSSPRSADAKVPVGVLCLIDPVKGHQTPMSDRDRELLADIGQMITEQIELAWQTIERERAEQRRLLLSRLLSQALQGQQFQDSIDIVAMQTETTREMRRILNRESQQCDLTCILELSPTALVDILTSPIFESSPSNPGPTVNGSGWGKGHQSAGGRRRITVLAGDLSPRTKDMGYDLKRSLTGVESTETILKWLKNYADKGYNGKLAYSNGQGPLMDILPNGTQSYVAIPLFNGSKPYVKFLSFK
jgi:hypothetical protein